MRLFSLDFMGYVAPTGTIVVLAENEDNAREIALKEYDDECSRSAALCGGVHSVDPLRDAIRRDIETAKFCEFDLSLPRVVHFSRGDR